ncbi:MAG: hypothetical protein AB7G25_09445 [Sphingomonadaceae bacterium]
MQGGSGSARKIEQALAALAVAAVIAAGVILRLWNVPHQPLWLDEAYSAYAAARNFDFLWNVVPTYETHPPFYYSMVRVWTLAFGDSLVALRALGIICGIAAIFAAAFAMQAIARLLDLPRSVTLIAMACAMMLVALSPMPLELSRMVRPYAPMMLVYALAIGTLFTLARRLREGDRLGNRHFIAWLILLALMLWLHNMGILFAGTLGLAFLILCMGRGWRKPDWIWFFAGHLTVGLIWLPAILIMADQAPGWIKSTWLRFSPDLIPYQIGVLLVGNQAMSWLSGAGLALFATWRLARMLEGLRTFASLLLLATLPAALSIAISATITPVFIIRIMAPISIASALLIALGAGLSRGVGRVLAGVAIVIILTQMGLSGVNTRKRAPPEDWYGVVHWIESRMRPGDLVLTYPNEGSLPFDRAVGDLGLNLPSTPIPVAVPAIDVGGWYPTGSRGVVSLPRDRLRAIARSAPVAAAPTVWLIRMGPWAYDKGDVFLQELGHGRVRVAHTQMGVIVLDGLRRADVK